MDELNSSSKYRLGCLSDKEDSRDKKLKVSIIDRIFLPAKADLRQLMPPIYDQGSLGSCTAHAVSGIMEYNKNKQKSTVKFPPSCLYIYYNTRVIEGTVNEDSGASLRNAIKSVVNNGICSIINWPYTIQKFKDKPSTVCYAEGDKNQALVYEKVPLNLRSIKATIVGGFPIVIGINVYSSFMSDEVARTGIVPMPNPPSDTLEGGHAVLISGYDDSKKAFLVRNSWGLKWGQAGYFWLPYQFLDRGYMNDLWTVKQVE